LDLDTALSDEDCCFGLLSETAGMEA
jgi:hypothetical protein